MIKILKKEYKEGDLAIKNIEVTFFKLPIYKSICTSTNRIAVQQLTTMRPTTKIVGFNYENNNKNKKTKSRSKTS